MKKLVVLAALALTLGLVSMAKAGTFMDVPEGHWAADAVQKLSDAGLIKGYPDGTFKGNQPLTRYEYAMIVARMMDWIANSYCTKDGCTSKPVTPESVDTSKFITKDQLDEAKAIVEKLAAEFKDELAALKAQVDTNTKDIATLNDKVNNLPLSKIKIDGGIRQRLDVFNTDMTSTQLAGIVSSLHGIAVGATLPLSAGYEFVPRIDFSDAVTTDNVFYTIGLKKHIANQAALGAIALGTNNTPLDIDQAYVALDYTKDVKELDLLKVTSGYQKVVFGPYGGLVDNRGLDSTAGVRLDMAKDIVSVSGFAGLASAVGNAVPGIGTTSKDVYSAVRMGLKLGPANIGFNWLPTGVGKEKAWGADLDAALLKDSPFLKAIRGEYFKITDLVSGASPAAGLQDYSYLIGLDVYKTKAAGLTVSYADIPAVPTLSGISPTPLSEYTTGCPTVGLDVAGNNCFSWDSGNVVFPAGFKGIGVEGKYVVLGDVELGGKAIFGDFAGGTIPPGLNAVVNGQKAEGHKYPGFGSVSVTKPINKSSKFRVEYWQQGKNPVIISRTRGELLINF